MTLSLTCVTWNLNSIRSRLPHLLEFLKTHAPDVVLLQELKLESDKFPYLEIEDMGYNCAVHGQKTYNGVAILSKFPLEDITTEFPADEGQARYIEALTTKEGEVFRVASIYVPNGQEIGSDKFYYKMRFYDALFERAKQLLSYEETLILGADYNVAYLAEDVYDAKAAEGTICYNAEERAKFQKLLNLGLYDAFRSLHPDAHAYSWWDYRAGKFEQDMGLRIDHLLLSAEAQDRLTACKIMKEERAKDKPSDHAPVWAEFRVAS
jgi:exodeoxyribonuclease III